MQEKQVTEHLEDAGEVWRPRCFREQNCEDLVPCQLATETQKGEGCEVLAF